MCTHDAGGAPTAQPRRFFEPDGVARLLCPVLTPSRTLPPQLSCIHIISSSLHIRDHRARRVRKWVAQERFGALARSTAISSSPSSSFSTRCSTHLAAHALVLHLRAHEAGAPELGLEAPGGKRGCHCVLLLLRLRAVLLLLLLAVVAAAVRSLKLLGCMVRMQGVRCRVPVCVATD